MNPLGPNSFFENIEFSPQGFLIFNPFYDKSFELYFVGTEIVALPDVNPKYFCPRSQENLKPKRFKKL